MKQELIDLAISKAKQSICNYKISAIGLNSRGDVIASSTNKHKGCGKGLGLHAEVELIRKYGRKIRSIVLCRVGRSGILRNIHPCPSCQKILDKMNIRVYSIAGIK